MATSASMSASSCNWWTATLQTACTSVAAPNRRELEQSRGLRLGLTQRFQLSLLATGKVAGRIAISRKNSNVRTSS